MTQPSLVPPAASTTPLSKLPLFDARAVPVLGVDAHLPAVPPERLTPEALRQRFTGPAPVWEPEVSAERRFAERQPMRAAVLIAIVAHQDGTSLLLTQRTEHLSTHSGQIAFPGGKADDTDPTPAATALREAHEEVGLEAGYVEVLGNLPIYVTGTNFIITPVVALVRPGFTMTLSTDEVASAFEVPLAFLMNPANHQRHAYDWEGVRREWFSMPFREREGDDERFIWGATAGMLRNLYRFLSA